MVPVARSEWPGPFLVGASPDPSERRGATRPAVSTSSVVLSFWKEGGWGGREKYGHYLFIGQALFVTLPPPSLRSPHRSLLALRP